MYKTIEINATEPGMYGPESSHSNKMREAIEKINAENGKIVHIHTTEIPQFNNYGGVGLGYQHVGMKTIIIYE